MISRALVGIAMFLGLSPLTAFAQQQAAICNQIRVELASLDQQGGRGGNPREAQRLRTELSRVQLALRTNECGQRGFFSSPPPVCGPLQAQANQLSAQLQRVEGGAGGPNAGRRAQLVAAFRNYGCDSPREPQRGVVYAAPQAPSLFEQIFGGRNSRAVVDPEPEQRRELDPELDEELREKARLGGRMAICVRTCDGFFFPVNYEGLSGGGSYEDVCQALCPSADTDVFFMRLGADIETAASRSGTPYMSMPYAKQFQQKHDDACFCKPRNVTWAEAAKQTEDVVEARRGDVVVTPEQAAAMTRIREVQQSANRRNANARQQPQPSDDTPAPVPESQIPTAGTASAGIGPRSSGRVVLNQTQGQTREVVGPDGQKRQIRVLSPDRSAQ